MESYENILQVMKDKYESESGSSIDDVSDIGLRLQLVAGEVYNLRNSLEWLRKQAFPQSAVGNQLDLHAEQRGIHRKSATKAQGTLTFSRLIPISLELEIPTGTVCAVSGDSMTTYETTEDAVLPIKATSVTVKAQAISKGRAGNAAIGYVNTLVTPPVGIEKVKNEAAFTGGVDAETDDELRRRLISSISSVSNGTNAEFYKRIALETSGISSVSVIPRANGTGTVTLYCWGDGQAPAPQVLTALAAKLNAKREINVNVTVSAATASAINIYVYIVAKIGSVFSVVKEQVEQSIREYFKTFEIGDYFYRNDLGAHIMKNTSVENYAYAVSVKDVATAKTAIPILGTLTVEED